MNYSLFDYNKALLIKLGEKKRVLRAMRGFKELSREEI